VRVHSLTISFTPGLPSWPTTLQTLALVASPKLGLQQHRGGLGHMFADPQHIPNDMESNDDDENEHLEGYHGI